MTVILLLLAINIFWAVGTILVKKGYSHFNAWQSYFIDAFYIALPLWIMYGIISGGNLREVTPQVIIISLYASIFYAVYYYVLDISDVSRAVPIIGTYPVFAVIPSLVFLNEKLAGLALSGIVITFCGILLVSFKNGIKIEKKKWFYLALLVSFGYGTSDFLQKIALNSVGTGTYVMLLAISQCIVVIVWRLFRNHEIPKILKRKSANTLVGITLFNIGAIAFYLALEKGLASIVVPLSSSYVVFVVILSMIILQEKTTRRQLVGVILVVLGVILVNISPKSLLPDKITMPQKIEVQQLSPTPMIFRKQKARVTRVIDGDSVALSTGEQVRYIGIDAPEIFDGATGKKDCFADQAKKTNTALVLNQEVELEADVNDKDKYGRLLRYVYVEDQLVNEFLLRWGYAKMENYFPEKRYMAVFREAQNEAQMQNRGLWGNCQTNK